MMGGVDGAAEPIDVTDDDVNTALEACGGDARATIKALLIAGQFLERELDEARQEASRGYVRRGPVRREVGPAQ
ncbi:hypothetical protein [Ancylobacter vacuolatus]|uniref:Uncharacterized protein n=1 Tax=Ancylobacter vacuolatus TaxID=223389 RepID=A0ABU0DM46_9HYPH|nr:hypothetical protein [Ancylobacter vacuolatus]MDQ0349391.1 hypothetical protein [Ancylobacter vacuolatus]